MIVPLGWIVGLLLMFSKKPSIPSASVSVSVSVSVSGGIDVLESVQESLRQNDTDTAFAVLAEAYARDPTESSLQRGWEAFFRTKIRLTNDTIDRMGLASLLSDQGQYGPAAQELQELLKFSDALPPKLQEKATSMLFRTQAAICDWKNYGETAQQLKASIQASLGSSPDSVPAVHPYEALMWPSLSLEDVTAIAHRYALRAMRETGVEETAAPLATHRNPPIVEVSRDSQRSNPDSTRKIRLGYISPDFTGQHPLAFLMQDAFRFHDSDRFDVYLYSLCEADASREVAKIQSAGTWKVVKSSNSLEIAQTIQSDELDILIDLCGYTGTSLMAQVMARRSAPIQIGYMGFPASSGAPFIDYVICDNIVVPRAYRHCYTEFLLVMPHCYFVNSHSHIQPVLDIGTNLDVETNSRPEHRIKYGLPPKGFIFCCHSRADKLDPATFQTWLRALQTVRVQGRRDGNPQQADAVMWLLKAGPEVEENLRAIAKDCDLEPSAIIFCDKAPRQEHLERLKLTDLFLDTPAYNAHTVGCDCLSTGVPMLSLLRPDNSPVSIESAEVATDKLASRVGASLLTSAGIPELVVSSMKAYQAMMIRCASDSGWFSELTQRLCEGRGTCPLLDTERWVQNLEAGLSELVHNQDETLGSDIYIRDPE